MAKINAKWHTAHRLPRRATLDQRVRWHVAHAKACGCRDIPKTVARELESRGIAVRTGRK